MKLCGKRMNKGNTCLTVPSAEIFGFCFAEIFVAPKQGDENRIVERKKKKRERERDAKIRV